LVDFSWELLVYIPYMAPMGNDVFMKLRILTPQSGGVTLKAAGPKQPYELQVQTFPSKDSSGEAKLDMCFFGSMPLFS